MPIITNKYSTEKGRKISEALKEHFKHHKHNSIGKRRTEESKRKMSLAHKGKTLSEEHKRKISEASKRWHNEIGFSEETKIKMREARIGYVHSKETREKISQANTGNRSWMKGLTKQDPRVKQIIEKRTETVKKLYAEGKLKPWNLGRPWSEEVKNKISARRKGKKYEEIMNKETALKFKQRLSELGRRFTGRNNPMYGRVGDKNPHFGKPAQHGKHSFKIDLGHHCRSNWEANYIRYLLWTNRNYKYEPKTFTIILPDGKKGTYTPDFLVDGKEWHELKGWETRSELKKWELFQKQYSDEKFVLINRNKYKKIEKLYKYIIPNWEF